MFYLRPQKHKRVENCPFSSETTQSKIFSLALPSSFCFHLSTLLRFFTGKRILFHAFPPMARVKRPSTLMEATEYDTFSVIVFTYHIRNGASSQQCLLSCFQNAPFWKPFSKTVSVFSSVCGHQSVDDRRNRIKNYLFLNKNPVIMLNYVILQASECSRRFLLVFVRGF